MKAIEIPSFLVGDRVVSFWPGAAPGERLVTIDRVAVDRMSDVFNPCAGMAEHFAAKHAGVVRPISVAAAA